MFYLESEIQPRTCFYIVIRSCKSNLITLWLRFLIIHSSSPKIQVVLRSIKGSRNFNLSQYSKHYYLSTLFLFKYNSVLIRVPKKKLSQKIVAVDIFTRNKFFLFYRNWKFLSFPFVFVSLDIGQRQALLSGTSLPGTLIDTSMFGGPVAAPINSPHLRKSGSRVVVSDIGDELGNGVENSHFHPIEVNGLKNATIPMVTVAIVPSPILLWRLKVLLFLVWGFICSKIGWHSVMRMSVDLRDLFLYEAFLYYNPLLLVTTMVWLWGINLWVFSQSNVNYAKIFDLHQNHLTHREIWKVLLYFAVVMILIFPFDIFYFSSRYYLLRTLWRIIIPLQAITFSDFFLADILTSMAKVFSDLERSICRMVHRQVATIAWFEADSVCGSHSIAIPLVLVLPYLFRFFQCLRQYKDTSERSTLLNALKYSTAVPVIFLSALKYHVLHDSWTNFYRPLWLLSSVLNSLYSFYWDVTRDWDLSGFTRTFKFNKSHLYSRLLHGRTWVYFWVIGSNLILRCTWTYKLSAHLRHNYLTVFTIAALEIFRRFQWIFFRVENEWNKMNSRSNIQLSMNDPTNEEVKLLSSNDHDV
ncbi:SPX and EXS domain-containing protein 5-like isoform X2 [Durio zibethinus]|uniref:SPX and EXS domain-containing protein 5-like isoform X2 n=1 Tax=Durio zibethinus TaxID=66656 RepID=A0A6P6AGH6_DURZI|nr:SPX and EXS domain-containing protein 5-like isoform X2 [Durio zibethinus]